MGNHTATAEQSGARVQPPAAPRRQRPEATILAGILAALGLEPDLKLFRNNVGVAEYGKAKVRYGLLPGSADLIGVLAPTGRLVSLEVKSDTGRLTPEQVKWAAMVRRMGGFAAVVRSTQEARDAIVRARSGASE